MFLSNFLKLPRNSIQAETASHVVESGPACSRPAPTSLCCFTEPLAFPSPACRAVILRQCEDPPHRLNQLGGGRAHAL